MKNIRFFLPENFQFLEVQFSIYLNRRVFVMGYQSTRQNRLANSVAHDEVISGSTLFAKVSALLCRAKRLNVHIRGI